MRLKGSDGGYFTVEAALIFPVVLVMILLVLWLWFFRYDKALMEMDTDAVVVRASQQHDMTHEEMAEYMVSEMQGRYKDAYISWVFGDITASSRGEKIECGTEGMSSAFSDNIPFFRISGDMSASVTRSRIVIPETVVIRTYRKVLAAKQAAEQNAGADGTGP